MLFNRIKRLTPGVVVETAASVQLTSQTHAGKTTLLNRAAGQGITLPAATGTGNTYTCVIGTTISSNTTTISAASAADSFVGMAVAVDIDGEGATGFSWNADANDDRVTLNGTTLGGRAGDVVSFTDISAGIFLVQGNLSQSGTSATPFSAAVS